MSDPKCIEALHMQKELDADGVLVGVSRQAIDETVEYVAALRAQVERLEGVVKERKRAGTTPGCKCCTDTWNKLAAVLRETEVDNNQGENDG